MPIYEYRCLGCNASFEVMRAITEMEHICICPSCKSSNTSRIFPTSSSNLRQTNTNLGNKQIKKKKTPNLIIEDCSFTNLGTGIKAKGAYIVGNRLKMRKTRTAIDAENSDIQVTNLDAKWNDS
jgi:putative FmdB family regulatory protein